jgi:hypothetical protein
MPNHSASSDTPKSILTLVVRMLVAVLLAAGGVVAVGMMAHTVWDLFRFGWSLLSH